MRLFPIFRACVRIWRYRLRRAATPTVRRSAGGPCVGVCNTTQGFLQLPVAPCVRQLQGLRSEVSLCELPRHGGNHVSPVSPLLIQLADSNDSWAALGKARLRPPTLRAI